MRPTEKHKSIFVHFIDAVNKHELDGLDAVVRSDFVRHCNATAPMSIESLADFKRFLREDRKTFPDAEQNVDAIVADGSLLAVRATLSGTQMGPMGPFPATERRVVVPLLAMIRFESDRIAEMWVEWDNLNLLKQLGLFPNGKRPDQ